MENAVLPVTALKFVFLDQSHYLLAGEGQRVKLFDHSTNEVLGQKQVFDTETIHGFCVLERSQSRTPAVAQILVWGGRSICVLHLGPDGVQRLRIVVAETRVDDWVLDGCLLDSRTLAVSQEDDELVTVLLCTSQNTLVKLDLDLRKGELRSGPVYVAGAGPRTLLYSGHLYLDGPDGKVLIAAGSAFGVVSYSSWNLSDDAAGPKLLAEFEGHEGSVFGVRISHPLEFDDGSEMRLLASCSDDRTIRIWNISGSSSSEPARRNGQCIASVMGHSSRIWGVRFAGCSFNVCRIISSGEDGTVQWWKLTSKPKEPALNGEVGGHDYEIVHDQTCRFNTGKNAWAIDITEVPPEVLAFAVGGADGRVSTAIKDITDPSTNGLHQFSMKQAMDSVKKAPVITETLSAKEVLQAMSGSWNISRTIESVNPLYPSGRLTGTATIAQRPPSGEKYEIEYFYSEKGDYITEQGLTMRASRQYVYRYDPDKDEASAWFVKTDGSDDVDYLFHILSWDKLDHKQDPQACSIRANGHHICIQDGYDAYYDFNFENMVLAQWKLRYSVKGPQKDYVANATYTRVSEIDDTSGEGQEAFQGTQVAYHGEAPKHPIMSKSDSFKTYAWVSGTDFLASTQQGSILLASVHDQNEHTATADNNVLWQVIGYDEAIRSACVMSSLPLLGFALIMGAAGGVLAYLHWRKKLVRLDEGPRNPVYLRIHLLSQKRKYAAVIEAAKGLPTVASVTGYFGSSYARLSFYRDEADSADKVGELSLELPSDFVVTCSFLFDQLAVLLLGSRMGDVCVYPLKYKPSDLKKIKPVQTLTLVHTDAITSLMALPNLPENESSQNDTIRHLLTVGRDGRFTVQRLVLPEDANMPAFIDVETIHVSVPPLGPFIEDGHICSRTQSLILWGFRSTSFVIWNETEMAETMNVECGGVHRKWSFGIRDKVGNTVIDSGGGKFVWTQASVCNVFSQKQGSHRVAQAGGHGREIKAVAVFDHLRIEPNDNPRSDEICDQSFSVATGSEDTTIRLFEYHQESGFRCSNVLTGHTTGLQKLAWSKDGRFLFSAAGCEELFVWSVQSSVPVFGTGVVCQGKCPPVSEDRDLRIMDLALISEDNNENQMKRDSSLLEGSEKIFKIGVVYSDSSLRIYQVLVERDKMGERLSVRFTILMQGLYSRSCLTQLDHGYFNNDDGSNTVSTSYLYTASTDGHLAVWPLPSHTELNHQNDTLKSIQRTPIHQSTIKSMFRYRLSSKENIIVTGGDDQAIALTRIKVTRASSTAMRSHFSYPTVTHDNAHLSAVTGLALLESKRTDDNVALQQELYFASVGNDQRLKTWRAIIKKDSSEAPEMSHASEGDDERPTFLVELSCESDNFTAVADASSLDYSSDKGQNGKLFVVGVGMECWDVIGGKIRHSKEFTKI